MSVDARIDRVTGAEMDVRGAALKRIDEILPETLDFDRGSRRPKTQLFAAASGTQGVAHRGVGSVQRSIQSSGIT